MRKAVYFVVTDMTETLTMSLIQCTYHKFHGASNTVKE